MAHFDKLSVPIVKHPEPVVRMLLPQVIEKILKIQKRKQGRGKFPTPLPGEQLIWVRLQS